MKKIFCILCITIMLAASGCASNTAAGGTLAEAVSLMDARQFDDAIEKLDQALKDGNDPRNVLRLKGITQMRQGDHEAAVATFSEALSHSGPVAGSMDYDINLYLADCLRSLDRNEEAVKVYGNILALKENDTETLFLRGETLLKMSDVEHARADFDRVIKIAPRDFDMRVRIYRAYEAYNLTEDMGMAVLSDALTSYGDAMSDYEKGQLAFYLGNNADAQSYLERALKSARGDERVKVALLLGQTGEKQGDYNFAIGVYTGLIDEDTAFAEVYNRRGVCKMAQGNYISAIADFQSGLNLGESEVRQALMRNEITAYEYAGDFAKAKEKMAEYLTLYPDDGAAKREEVFLSTR